MHKIDGAGHVANTWVAEDVALSRPPTEITADFMNALQLEIANVVEYEGGVLNKADNTQLLKKILSIVKGGDYKDSVRFTTTANIVLTGLGTQAGGDWPAALTAGERILAKNQTAGAENGIYIAAVGAWVRAIDADTGAELNSGAIIPVESGTINTDTNWQLTTDGVITIGTTALTFKIIGNFKRTYTGSDYHIFDNGLILQWGNVTTSAAGAGTVTLPIAFPNALLAGAARVSGSNTLANISSTTNTAVTVSAFNSANNTGLAATVYIFVVGF